MSEWIAETVEYRLKAAHMRKLADQAQNDLARAAYTALEASWLRLAQRQEFSGIMAKGDDEAEGRSA